MDGNNNNRKAKTMSKEDLGNALTLGIERVRKAEEQLAAKDATAKYAEIRERAKAAMSRMGNTIRAIVRVVEGNQDLFRKEFENGRTIYVESPEGLFSVNRERHSISIRSTHLTSLHIALDDLTETAMKSAAVTLESHGLLPNRTNLASAQFWLAVAEETAGLEKWTDKLEEMIVSALDRGVESRTTVVHTLLG